MRSAFTILFFLLFSLFSHLQGQVEINVRVKSDQPDLRRSLHNLSILSAQNPNAQLRVNMPILSGVKQVNGLKKGSGRSVGEIENVFTLTFDGRTEADVLAEFTNSGQFEWMEPNRSRKLHTAEPNDPGVADQWFHEYIKTFDAWDSTRGSSDVVIGILDTGIDYDHPEFQGQLKINAAEDRNQNNRFDPWPDSVQINGVFGDFDGIDADGNGFPDDVIGYDFTDQPRSPFGGDYLFPDPDPEDENNHGTLVAGIAGARADNNYGIAGIAPGCKLMTLRAFAANGSGEDDDIARAIVYAADNGVHVLNFSFGDIYPSQIMREAINYAYAKGVIMVGSAGNGTGDEVHYPSAFDHVISVSATDVSSSSGNEILWPLSSFGLSVDLAAPGSGIYTTIISDSVTDPFDAFSGTSTAAPMVSAAAALLLSQRGNCSPDQIHFLLTHSADDVGEEGWDHFTGAGRLNILKALQEVGAGHVRIISPENDGGAVTSVVSIIGSVMDAKMTSWSLEWQAGDVGTGNWNPILENQTDQKSNDTLGFWDLNGLNDGVYTLRLRVDQWDGGTQEHRIRFLLDNTDPVIDIKLAAPVWDNDERKYLIVFRSSDPGITTLQYYWPGGTSPVYTQTFDRLTRNGYFLLDAEVFPPGGGTLEYTVQSRNAAGLYGISAVNQANFQPDFIRNTGYAPTGAKLPMGHYLQTPVDFDGDGLLEVVMSEYDGALSFGPLRIYEFNAGLFSLVDSVKNRPVLIPKGVADTDGNGLQELLCSVNDSFYVVSQTLPTGFPDNTIFSELGELIYAEGFADTDADGQMELIGKDFKDYFIYNGAGSNWTRDFQLADNTGDYQGSVAPRAVVEDFDGDNNPEFLFGDFDGDIVMYEWNGTAYDSVFADTSGLEKSGSYIVSGDFDDDGSPEFFVATHPTFLRNDDFEYETGYWLLRIFESNLAGNYVETWRDYLFDVDTDGYNAATSGDLDNDGGAEIIFTTFPRTYVIDFDGGYGMDWFHYGALCTHHMVGDFDGNGIQEFALGRGDTAFFFEKDVNYGGPETPLGLTGRVADATTATLTWQSVANASDYLVWRGEVVSLSSVQIAPLDSVTGVTDFTDTGLTPGATYLYVIQAKNTGLSPTHGEFSNYILLTPHAPGRLDSASAISANQIELSFSVPVTDAAENLAQIRVDGSISPIAILANGDPGHRLIVSLANDLAPGTHTVSIDTTFLDADLAPLDTAFLSASFSWQPDTSEVVILASWEALDNKNAVLEFTHDMDNSVLNAANYAVYPYGNVLSVASGTNARQVILTLDEVNFGALGNPISIVVTGVQALDGSPINEKEGNVATFAEFADDLSGIYVYPNPVEPTVHFDGLRFAGLPKVADITVITVSGRRIIELSETDGDGGLTWDMLDYTGTKILPGKYIFKVTTPEGGEFLGKFAVLDR